jgi:hypothetical protein
MNGYVYESFEPGLWTVGHHDQDGKFRPESDHKSPNEASTRVHHLNGGTNAALTERAERLAARLADAEYQTSRWVADAAAWERRTDALGNVLDGAAAVLDDIATEDGNGYCGQRARSALKSIREARATIA